MAGGGLIAIKRRIKSISNTKKITKAMGLVATSKLRRCRQLLESNIKYYNSMNNLMSDIMKSVNDDNFYKNGNNSKKKLYVLMSSDSGLCGGFNGNIIKELNGAIGSNLEDSLIMVVGQKGSSYYRRTNYNVIEEYLNMPDLPTVKESKKISVKILELFSKGEVGEVYVAYTRFISQIKQQPVIEKVFPLAGETSELSYNDSIKLEPDANNLLNQIVPVYSNSKILNLMVQSKTSEQAIRMSAMDGATKNANDLLDQLNLKYNRMRQGAITQELTEIVSGAEAQK